MEHKLTMLWKWEDAFSKHLVFHHNLRGATVLKLGRGKKESHPTSKISKTIHLHLQHGEKKAIANTTQPLWSMVTTGNLTHKAHQQSLSIAL